MCLLETHIVYNFGYSAHLEIDQVLFEIINIDTWRTSEF